MFKRLIQVVIFQLLECMYVRQSIDLLEGLIPGGDEGKDMKPDHLQKLFIFAMMFSLGGILELDDRKKVGISSSVKAKHDVFIIYLVYLH